MTLHKSINLRDDLGRQDALRHYMPTKKSLRVIEAICGTSGSKATHVIAPYGSGKSFAALAALRLLSVSGETETNLLDAIRQIAPERAETLEAVRATALTVTLHGVCQELSATLAKEAELPKGAPLAHVLEAMVMKCRREGYSRIAIVWDEFGQHLETLVREGRNEDLLAVQELAEWAVRRGNPAVTLTTLMHQGVSSYTRRVANNAQAAWRKIEGRFDILTLQDEGADVYDMIAGNLDSIRSGHMDELAKAALAQGFFAAIPDKPRLEATLQRSAPLSVAALDLLPRLTSQISQNERTLFGFLNQVGDKSGGVIGLPELYDYFAPALRADTGAGGAYKRFIEAQTVLARAESDTETAVIKAIMLLQLGPTGEKLKLPRERLLFALTSDAQDNRDACDAAISALLSRRLLLYRERADDLSIWHGAEVDLNAMITEEAARFALSEDLTGELSRLFPPEAYTAPAYNYRRALTRFARSEYCRLSSLLNPDSRAELLARVAKEDAFVALLIDAHSENAALAELAADLPAHVILAAPKRSTEVTNILSELLAVESLLSQKDLLAQDPMILQELRELRGENEMQLRNDLERLITPDRGQVTWFTASGQWQFDDGRDSSSALDAILEQRFPATPRISNEQVVRRRISSVTRSARRRAMLAVIERSGQPSLGYAEATSADASLYRTVFEINGVYRKRGQSWGWSGPEELQDTELRAVWQLLKAFFTDATKEPRPMSGLIERLTAPPIGLREGVIPLLVCAALQAFARSIALRDTTSGRAVYLDDITPTVVENLCEQPQHYQIEVLRLTLAETSQLKQFISVLSGAPDPREPDLIRNFYDAVLAWRQSLPPTALTSGGLGDHAEALQPLLRRRAFDPFNFLTRELPEAFGAPAFSERLWSLFTLGINDIEAVTESYARRAIVVATEVFNSKVPGASEPLLAAASAWARSLPLEEQQIRQLDQEARGILNRARTALDNARGERAFATALSGILSGTGFEEWDDSSTRTFRTRLESALLRAEDLALDSNAGSPQFDRFLKRRLVSVLEQFNTRIGPQRLTQLLLEVQSEAPNDRQP